MKNINLLDKFPRMESIFEERKCIICGKVFINESHVFFERHVNTCADESAIKAKKENQTLLKYFKFQKSK